MISTLSRRTMIGLVGFLVLLAVPMGAEFGSAPYLINFTTRLLIYAIAVVSLDLVLGYGAMVSFGHAMFFAVGGYTVAIIAHHVGESTTLFGWSGSMQALIVWPIALLVCALLGLVVGYLALRTRGMQFIMITLAFGQLIYFVLMSLQVYGADDGLMMAERNALPLISTDNPNSFYYLCWLVLAAWTYLCSRFVNSRFGMVLQALRQSERRALNLGANPLPYRLFAFALSAVGTGMAGILWANYAGLVTPDMAAWTKSGELMAMVILGGVGTLLGPIAGAVVFLGLEQVLASITEHWMVIMGPILVIIALTGKSGLFGRWLGYSHDK